jgi:hypothetical protein
MVSSVGFVLASSEFMSLEFVGQNHLFLGGGAIPAAKSSSALVSAN